MGLFGPERGETRGPTFSPSARFHLLEGMAHGSWYGHAHEPINAGIEAIAPQA